MTHGVISIIENSCAIHTSFPPICSNSFRKETLPNFISLLWLFWISLPPDCQWLWAKRFPALCQYLSWHLISVILHFRWPKWQRNPDLKRLMDIFTANSLWPAFSSAKRQLTKDAFSATDWYLLPPRPSSQCCLYSLPLAQPCASLPFPRWNLELLWGGEKVKKVMAKTATA